MKEKIQQLREELNQHNYNYYVLNNPTISDYEFDQKLKELQALEQAHPEFYDENSPTVRVGGTITKSFPTVVHEYRMYSLDKSPESPLPITKTSYCFIVYVSKLVKNLSIYSSFSFDLYCWIKRGCFNTTISPNKVASLFNFCKKVAFFLPNTNTF